MQHKCQETYLCQLAVQIDVFGMNFWMILFLEWKTVESGEKKKALPLLGNAFYLNTDVYYSNLRAPSLMTTSYLWASAELLLEFIFCFFDECTVQFILYQIDCTSTESTAHDT